ncbi:hypothetical protein Sjap_020374 [Stephania japonica]|uniref:Uncharacterized protein n=1 Tax=Stephania japonica TaxID=461633 RepID=A0AAP0F0I5_9MAGN
MRWHHRKWWWRMMPPPSPDKKLGPHRGAPPPPSRKEGGVVPPPLLPHRHFHVVGRGRRPSDRAEIPRDPRRGRRGEGNGVEGRTPHPTRPTGQQTSWDCGPLGPTPRNEGRNGPPPSTTSMGTHLHSSGELDDESPRQCDTGPRQGLQMIQN